MGDRPTHLFKADGQTLFPSELVRGPWNHDLQHGGAVSGALGYAITEECGTEEGRIEGNGTGAFALTRMTTEILRPVPVAPLRYRAQTVRRGRRSMVVSAELSQDDVLVARATSQWAVVLNEDGSGVGAADSAPDAAVPLRPTTVTDPGAADLGYPRPGFNCDVFEMRCLIGSTEEPGPGTIWVRQKAGLVEGCDDHPVHRLAMVADLGNAVGWDLAPSGMPMVNPDVTLQLFRYPVGPWICLQSRARIIGSGIGLMETRLWDGDGQFGLTLSTSMESPIPLSVDLPGGQQRPTGQQE